MPRAIVEVTTDEVEGLVRFLEEQARKQRVHRFFVKNEELKPYLLEPTNINRIRHSMKEHLEKRGINILFQAQGYYFTLPTSLDLEVFKTPEVEKMDIPDTPSKLGTFSKFKYTYHAPAVYRYVKEAVARGCTPLLVGPPGCGKSRMAEEIASHAGIQAVRRPLSQTQDSGELIGTMHVIKEGGVAVTHFVDGLITRCARIGMFCILDELDNATPAANEALKQISEDGANLVVETERGTEVIPKHPNFRMIFTANTWCTGDATGLFPNAQTQNRALMDRIRPKFELDYQPKIEEDIIRPIVPKPVLDALYKFDKDDPSKNGLVYLIREMIKKQELPAYLGLRSILGFAEHFSFLGWNRAFLCDIIFDMPEEHRNAIIEVITSRLGKWAEPTMDDLKITKFMPELKKNGFA